MGNFLKNHIQIQFSIHISQIYITIITTLKRKKNPLIQIVIKHQLALHTGKLQVSIKDTPKIASKKKEKKQKKKKHEEKEKAQEEREGGDREEGERGERERRGSMSVHRPFLGSLIFLTTTVKSMSIANNCMMTLVK